MVNYVHINLPITMSVGRIHLLVQNHLIDHFSDINTFQHSGMLGNGSWLEPRDMVLNVN
jgi:hypothetical protein